MAFAVGFRKRFTNNWSAGATYLLSGNKDNASQFDRQPSNPFDLDDEFGTSQHDQRHRFTANWVWRLPHDFIFSGLVYGSSGNAVRSGRRDGSVANGLDLYGTAPAARGLIPRPICGLDPRFDAACSFLGIPDGTRIPRNAARADAVFRVDLRIGWQLYASEGVFIEPTLEIFNVFNRENFDPQTFNTNVGSSGYGQPGRSANQPLSPTPTSARRHRAVLGLRIRANPSPGLHGPGLFLCGSTVVSIHHL